jgi:hypothetical protein
VYAALTRLLSESYTQQLLNELNGIRSVQTPAELAQTGSWSRVEKECARANRDRIYGHPISCNGLSLWVERLPAEEREDMLQEMQEMHRQKTRLADYWKQRQEPGIPNKPVEPWNLRLRTK